MLQQLTPIQLERFKSLAERLERCERNVDSVSSTAGDFRPAAFNELRGIYGHTLEIHLKANEDLAQSQTQSASLKEQRRLGEVSTADAAVAATSTHSLRNYNHSKAVLVEFPVPCPTATINHIVKMLASVVLLVIAVLLRPAFMTWSVAGLEYSTFDIHWFDLRSSSTLSVNVSLTNPNILPMYLLKTEALLYYPDARGRQHFLGTSVCGGHFVYHGVNDVELAVHIESIRWLDAMALERGKRGGRMVLSSTSTVRGLLLGIFPLSADLQCDHAIRTRHSFPSVGALSIPVLEGAECNYSLFKGFFEFRHAFGDSIFSHGDKRKALVAMRKT
mmetsp:Transcript_80659/g.157618  ORF Transcript_80659/g.157618 Transcript_80659/m.157618 type:complete len:332 (+) Transcript_80659:106-1101(+)